MTWKTWRSAAQSNAVYLFISLFVLLFGCGGGSRVNDRVSSPLLSLWPLISVWRASWTPPPPPPPHTHTHTPTHPHTHTHSGTWKAQRREWQGLCGSDNMRWKSGFPSVAFLRQTGHLCIHYTEEEQNDDHSTLLYVLPGGFWFFFVFLFSTWMNQFYSATECFYVFVSCCSIGIQNWLMST